MSERPLEPTVFDTMHDWFRVYLEELHTAIPGRIHTYDDERQDAQVELLIRVPVLQPDGSSEYVEHPILPHVPVLMPRMGDWFVSLPISPGDFVLVVFCEQAIGHWLAGDGSITPPGDLQRHSLSHAVAIPGLAPRQRNIPNDQGPAGTLQNAAEPGSRAMVIGKLGGTRIAIKNNGDVVMVQGSTKVFEIVGGVVKLSASATLNVARATDPVDRTALMATWMGQVESALNGFLAGSVTPFVGSEVGSVAGGNANVKA